MSHVNAAAIIYCICVCVYVCVCNLFNVNDQREHVYLLPVKQPTDQFNQSTYKLLV